MFLYRIISRSKEFTLVCLVEHWLVGFLSGLCFSGWLDFGLVENWILVVFGFFLWGEGIGIYLFTEKER